MCRGGLRYGILLCMLWGITFGLSAQNDIPHLVSPFHSYKIDFKIGSAGMLSKVPAKYLDKLNNVNIPIESPGVNVSVAARKAITGHLEVGYQCSYIGLYGQVYQQSRVYRVHTQALENSYLFCCNLWRTDYYRPLNNCFVYYKIGAITLKNEPRQRMPDGSLQPLAGVKAQRFFFSSGVAVATGLGAGFHRQLTPNLGLQACFEFSRSSDTARDIYKADKIFYNSPNTVNKYMALSFGASYTFDLVKPRNQSKGSFRLRSETEKRLRIARINRQKRKSVRKW